MESAPIFTLRFSSIAPGANLEARERFQKWRMEVYVPMTLSTEGATGADQYRIIHETPQYPQLGGVTHRESLHAWNAATETMPIEDIQREYIAWQKRGVVEAIWSAAYELIKGFRSGQISLDTKPDTRVENAPIMHLEAYDLTKENGEKFYNWFSEFGCKIFIPLFVNLPGLKGYDWYRFTGLMRSKEVRELEYPEYLSVIYFDSIKSFENFEKSSEQNAFQKALRTVFPRGLKYEWYVQYQLEKSWRK